MYGHLRSNRTAGDSPSTLPSSKQIGGETGRRLAGALRRLPDSGACHKHSSGFQAHPRSALAGRDWPEARGSAQAGSRRSTLPSSKRIGGRLAEDSRERSGGFQAFDVAILEAPGETGRRLAEALRRLPDSGACHKHSSGFQAFDVAILEAPAGDTGRRLAEALRRLPGIPAPSPPKGGAPPSNPAPARAHSTQAEKTP